MEKKKFRIGILPFVMITNIGLGITPALARIGHYFKEIEASSLSLIVSMGAVCGLLGSLLAGKLQSHLTQKAVLLIGAALLSFGLLPVILTDSFKLLVIVSVLTGSGGGMLTATIPAMITRYSDETERTAWLGYKTGFQGMGTMLITFIAGLLAVAGWQYTYLIFLLAMVAIGVGAIYLPDDNGLKDGDHGQSSQMNSQERQLGLSHCLVCGLFGVVISLTLLSSTLSNNMALHADRLAIGNSSLAGLALSFQSLGVILAGFSMPLVVGLFGIRTLSVSFFLTTLGLGGLAFIYHPLGLMSGALLFGYGYGLILTRVLFMMARMVKSRLVPVGMGLISAFMSLGFALSPLLFNQLGTLFSRNLATTSFKLACVLSGVILMGISLTKFEQKALDN